jgi:hypothetical protein
MVVGCLCECLKLTDERSACGNIFLKALESYDSCLSLGKRNISGGRCESGALSQVSFAIYGRIELR